MGNIFKMTQNLDEVSHVVLAIALLLLSLAFPLLLYAIVKGCRKLRNYISETPRLRRQRIPPRSLPEESQEAIWSISIPEETTPTELPSYEELQSTAENKRPPGYWSLFPYKIYYDQPVVTETL